MDIQIVRQPNKLDSVFHQKCKKNILILQYYPLVFFFLMFQKTLLFPIIIISSLNTFLCMLCPFTLQISRSVHKTQQTDHDSYKQYFMGRDKKNAITAIFGSQVLSTYTWYTKQSLEEQQQFIILSHSYLYPLYITPNNPFFCVPLKGIYQLFYFPL